MSLFTQPQFNFGALNGVGTSLGTKIAPTFGGTTLNRTTRRPNLSQPSSSSLSNFFAPLGGTNPTIGTFNPTPTITTAAPIDVGSNLLGALTSTAGAVLSSIGSGGDTAPPAQQIDFQPNGGGGGMMDNPLLLAAIVLGGGYVLMKAAK